MLPRKQATHKCRQCGLPPLTGTAIRIDDVFCRAYFGGIPVRLTPLERDIVACFKYGADVMYADVWTRVWGHRPEEQLDRKTLAVMMNKINRRLRLIGWEISAASGSRTTPYSLKRVSAAAEAAPSPACECGRFPVPALPPITVDLKTNTAMVRGVDVRLAPIEAEVLYVVSTSAAPQSTAAITDRVWGVYQDGPSPLAVSAFVAHINRKIAHTGVTLYNPGGRSALGYFVKVEHEIA